MRYALVGLVLVLASTAAAKVSFPNLEKPLLVKDVTATSTFADKADAYAAWRALAYETRGDGMNGDYTLWSAWCEGKKDEGIGETVTIRLAEPTHIDTVRIAAGVWRTAGLFKANNIITALDVIADGKSQTVKPPAEREWVEAKINAKVTTLAFRIAAVKKGRMNDSCIAGIDLFQGKNAMRLSPVIGGDPKVFAALPGALREIQAALGADDHKGLEPLLEFPFSNNDDTAFFEGDGSAKPSKAASWAAVVAACKTYRAATEKAGDRYVNPKACPGPTNFDDEDERTSMVRVVGSPSANTVIVTFPSHHEVVVSWRLHWKDRWRLQAIDYE